MNHGKTRAFIVHHPSAMKEIPMAADDLPSDQDPVSAVVIESSDNSSHDAKAIAPAWLLSIGTHALVVGIMAAMVYAAVPEEVELPPIRVEPVAMLPPKPPEHTPIVPDHSELAITVTDQPTVTEPLTTITVDDVETSTDENHDVGNPGNEQAVSNQETGSTGAFLTMGPSGGGASMFSKRIGIGKHRATAKHQDGGRTSSVESALRWFKRHQSPNGMWDVDQYQSNCMDGVPKCEPGVNQAGKADIACTAYALMCYLGAGYDHQTPNKYRATVAKAMDWLLAQQNAEGLFGERNYEHAIATMALAEALGMSSDTRLKEPAQKAVNVILERQAKDPNAKDKAYGGLGWDYVAGNAARNDTSVTGWNLMALKSALGAGLQVGSGMTGAKAWLERTWKAANPGWKTLDPYQGESGFPYTFDATTEKVGGNGAGEMHLSCVGALCAVYLGHHQGDVMLETMANTIMKNNFPTTYPTNTYFLYYNTLAIFQIGGERWDKWNLHVAKLLATAQRADESCFNGSWDYAGTGFHGHETGRLLSTAYACLSQEVIWRYEQVGNK